MTVKCPQTVAVVNDAVSSVTAAAAAGTVLAVVMRTPVFHTDDRTRSRRSDSSTVDT